MEEREVGLRDYIRIVLKRKKMIFWIVFVSVVVSAVVSLLLPKTYEASVTLMVQTRPKYQVALDADKKTVMTPFIDPDVSIETYRNLIKDRHLEERSPLCQ